jgi:hypothetical protein
LHPSLHPFGGHKSAAQGVVHFFILFFAPREKEIHQRSTMTVDNMMNAPKVREVVSSKPITAQAAHELLSRFLEAERQDIVSVTVDDEVIIRLEAVCRSLRPSTTTTTRNTSASSSSDEKEQKKAKKAAKKAAKKERKEKRKREKEAAEKSKKTKT